MLNDQKWEWMHFLVIVGFTVTLDKKMGSNNPGEKCSALGLRAKYANSITFFLFFILDNEGVRTSLRAPRLIPGCHNTLLIMDTR